LVLLYDGHEGGSGIVEMAFDRFEELTALTLEMISGCDCELGCPRCVFDRLCGDDNQPMDLPGAVEVLSSLIPIPVT
jgi:DEAD/DEAH box helicase domain-containing protein